MLLDDSVASQTPLSHSLSHTAGRFSCQPNSTVTFTVTYCWNIQLPATLHCHTHCHMLLDDSVASHTPLSHSLSHTAGRFSCQPHSTVTLTVTYCWKIKLPATLHCHTHCHMLLDDSVASQTPTSVVNSSTLTVVLPKDLLVVFWGGCASAVALIPPTESECFTQSHVRF